jgi:phosphate transport system permease protein
MERLVSNEINTKRIANRSMIDKIAKWFFLSITLICASAIVIIVTFIVIRGVSPFVNDYTVNGELHRVDLVTFLTGTTWFKPPNNYGIGFIIINTLYIVFLAILVAVPVAILTSLFISKIAPRKVGATLSYIIELLAAIPSIVYGVFGRGVITEFVKNISSVFGYQSAGGTSTMSTVLVLAIMILPTITMLSVTSINAVNKNIIHGSLALGASPTQTNFKVVLTSAKSGIFSGIILGVGRALGEATAISMVIGNRGNGPTFNLFDTSRTLTSTMLMGLKETTGLDYDIRFSVGIVLIIIILVTNLILNIIKSRIGRVR